MIKCQVVLCDLELNEDKIAIEEKIKLHNAIMVIGLDGWGNAGEVSTFVVKYLADKLEAKKFGEIPPEKFYNYLIQRPITLIREGIIQSYISPRNDLFYWRKKINLVLLLGYEPHLNWSTYTKTILKLAKEIGVERIYTIGGYLADISHEEETIISASTNNEKLISELKKIKVEFTNYQGPTSIYSEILWKAKEKKIDVVSLWCAVPTYVNIPYPKAAYNILEKITQLIGIKLDLKDLKKKAETFKIQLEKEAKYQPQLRSFIENLGGTGHERSKEKESNYIA